MKSGDTAPLDQHVSASAPVEGPAPRLAYRPPRLRHLGSVRELTLGGTSGMAEGAGTFRAAM